MSYKPYAFWSNSGGIRLDFVDRDEFESVIKRHLRSGDFKFSIAVPKGNRDAARRVFHILNYYRVDYLEYSDPDPSLWEHAKAAGLKGAKYAYPTAMAAAFGSLFHQGGMEAARKGSEGLINLYLQGGAAAIKNFGPAIYNDPSILWQAFAGGGAVGAKTGTIVWDPHTVMIASAIGFGIGASRGIMLSRRRAHLNLVCLGLCVSTSPVESMNWDIELVTTFKD